MTKYIEFEGKNIDSALEKASTVLNRPVDKIQYDVVSYGSSGIFGLVGAKKAKIRIKGEQTQIPKEIQKEAKQQARDLVKNAFDIEDLDAETSTQEPDPQSMDRAANIGKEVLQRLVDFITEEAVVSVQQTRERLLFKVDGGNSALLIGKRGQTLEALQYLTEKIINKQHDHRVRVMVDVEGYLNVRKATLKKMASRMAQKAQKINKPVTIGQMNAYDRRIVHLHLKENQAVRTQSVGEGYYRKLIIFPRKRRRSRNDN